MSRQLIINIDGDGFIYRSNHDRRPVGEHMYEKVLTRYPFRFCTSFIAGEATLYEDKFDLELARRILCLPNVDAASHSWSHPHDWSLDIDLDQEIDQSVRYINENMLPPGKSVCAFLWSGLGNPMPEAVARTEALKLANLNGGNIREPFSRYGTAAHFHARARSDWYWMDVSALMKRHSATKVYPFLCEYTGRLDGYMRVIDFFETHPELPVQLHIHWYSAVRKDSLKALINVLDWCLEQDLESVSVPQYNDTVRRTFS